MLYNNLLNHLVRPIFASIVVLAGLTIGVNTGQADGRPSIVVLGDSLVAGYQLPPDTAFPEQLQAELDARGIKASIIGAGVSGDTTSGGLSRLAWSVPEGTDAVILELGGNDALRGLPPAATASNLDTIMTRLKERGIKILLAGMLAPPNMGEEYASEFNAIYPALAKKHEVALYPFFLEGVMTVSDMTLPDGMHPNEAGVDVIVRGILPMVEALLEQLHQS